MVEGVQQAPVLVGTFKRASSRQDATKVSLKCSPMNSLMKNMQVENIFRGRLN